MMSTQKGLRHLVVIVTVLPLWCLAKDATPAGDRGHHVNMIYPQDAFYQNGGAFSIITRFMQGGTTYKNYIHETQGDSIITLSSQEFPALGTDSQYERIIPLYTSRAK